MIKHPDIAKVRDYLVESGYPESGDALLSLAAVEAELDSKDTIEAALTKAEAVAPREFSAWVGDMKTSAGMDYYVCVGRGKDYGEYMTPNAYKIRGRAEYDVARWNHLFGLCDAPDVLAFDTDEPPAVPVESGRKPLSETMYRGPAHPEGYREQFLDRRCLAADNVPTESLGRDAEPAGGLDAAMRANGLPAVSDALGYSRNFAAANPHLTQTTKDHITGLCDMLELASAHQTTPPAPPPASVPDGLCAVQRYMVKLETNAHGHNYVKAVEDPDGDFVFHEDAAAHEAHGLTSKQAWWAGARAGLGVPADMPRKRVADLLGQRVVIDVYQQDWMPGFAAFLDDGSLAENGRPKFAINLGAFVASVSAGDIEKSELPYFVAETLMHEVIHVIEKWAGVEFSEERVDALIEKYTLASRTQSPAPAPQPMTTQGEAVYLVQHKDTTVKSNWTELTKDSYEGGCFPDELFRRRELYTGSQP